MVTPTCRTVLLLLSLSPVALADGQQGADAAGADAHRPSDRPPTVSVRCASEVGARTECPADTASGVAMIRSTGPGQCLLGRTSGYNQTSIRMGTPKLTYTVFYYPTDTRTHRLDLQISGVNDSPARSTFGDYVGGQTGITCSVAFPVSF
jgi:hypothetical protein